MNMRKLLLTVIAVVAVFVSYDLLFSVVEWLRAKAGVGLDTCSPIDILAWQGCLFAASVVTGNIGYALWRSAGVVSLAGMLFGLGISMVRYLGACPSNRKLTQNPRIRTSQEPNFIR